MSAGWPCPRCWRGYDPGLIAGVCGCAGTIAAVIPPSIPFIMFAILTEQSVLVMFAAGVLPGLLTAIAYAAMIILRARLQPAIADGRHIAAADDRPGTWDQPGTWRLILATWPVLLLAGTIMLGLYGGFATPTEAGGLGPLAAVIIALLRRSLRFANFRAAIAQTAQTTAAILIIAVGTSTLTTYLALTGFPDYVAGGLAAFADSDLAFIVIVSIVLLALGTVLDPMGVMLLALPIFLPAVQERGLDMVWFGVIAVKYIEIGLITPPLGLNLFAVHGLMPRDISLGRVIRGSLWFLLTEMVVMVLLIAVPSISFWLPSVLR
ncbi:TRAP transporter large permease subunit (plasmid) [Tistrella bauzanensis]|uniref:TRAP transporter large permease n=1 Tax=Tistrella bauzanensis TaxID=657419 RepID=UPI00227D466B|nr:TRAP transporter large permease subunit [Tistrella bauzanensis]